MSYFTSSKILTASGLMVFLARILGKKRVYFDIETGCSVNIATFMGKQYILDVYKIGDHGNE